MTTAMVGRVVSLSGKKVSVDWEDGQERAVAVNDDTAGVLHDRAQGAGGSMTRVCATFAVDTMARCSTGAGSTPRPRAGNRLRTSFWPGLDDLVAMPVKRQGPTNLKFDGPPKGGIVYYLVVLDDEYCGKNVMLLVADGEDTVGYRCPAARPRAHRTGLNHTVLTAPGDATDRYARFSHHGPVARCDLLPRHAVPILRQGGIVFVKYSGCGPPVPLRECSSSG
jgi:hypothetical protein